MPAARIVLILMGIISILYGAAPGNRSRKGQRNPGVYIFGGILCIIASFMVS